MHNALHSLTLLMLTFVTGVQHLDTAQAVPTAAAAMLVPEADRTAPVTVMRSSDGLFYVDARVDGRKLRLLVDTGASMAVLTRADARRLGLRARPGGGRIETVGGRVDMATAKLDAIEIGGHRFDALTAAVVGEGLSVSLIGQDLLSRFGSIRIDGDRLVLG